VTVSELLASSLNKQHINKDNCQSADYLSSYREFKEKINLTDHDKDDEVSFNPQDTWFFNGKKSEKLTGDELLTVPHPALVVRITQKPSHLYLMLHLLSPVSFRFYKI
jgi:hypothetical protein